MKKVYFLSSVFLGFSASFASAGCQDSFKDCENTATCPPPEGDGDTSTGGVAGDGDGDGDGDAAGGGDGDTGGTVGGTGGGDGDGDGDSTGGMGGDPNDPCLLCGGVTPYCDAEDECVECLSSNHCATTETPVCDTAVGDCVECNASEDCDDPALPMCESNVCVSGCETPEDCTRFGALKTCDVDAGACVMCLTRDDCAGTVCERTMNTCVTGRTAGALGVCQECEYDDDCQVGQLCVEQVFDSEVVGNFCTWTRDERVGELGDCFVGGKPFAGQTAGPVASVEEQSAVVCVLATTTCPAFLQHRQSVAGCDEAGDDDACGVSDVDDGQCEETTGGTPLCTYPCLSDEDCRTSSTCTVDGYCSL